MTRRVRMIVVVNSRTGGVHGVTTDSEQAACWCQLLAERYGDDHGAARQFVDVVTVRDGTWWDD